jgi:hypothetical protein
MHPEVAGETTKSFRKDGNLDTPDQLMAVVDIEDQNTGRIRTAFLLRAIRHAEVEVSLCSRLGGDNGSQGEQGHKEEGYAAHGGILLSAMAAVKDCLATAIATASHCPLATFTAA